MHNEIKWKKLLIVVSIKLAETNESARERKSETESIKKRKRDCVQMAFEF